MVTSDGYNDGMMMITLTKPLMTRRMRNVHDG